MCLCLARETGQRFASPRIFDTLRRTCNYRQLRCRVAEPRLNLIIEKDRHAVSLFLWQGRQDSNLQPTVLETATLPIELLPYE
jgi:hypothetical protein